MYIPAQFAETRVEVLHALVRAHPFATLVCATADGLNAEHLPLLLAPGAPAATDVLRGHIARANPLWQALESGQEVLAVFQGPQSYVTPSWYPSKREHGRVVPTWNYAVVHAHGRVHFHHDPVWLRELLDNVWGCRAR